MKKGEFALFDGKTHTEWAEIVGLSLTGFRIRLSRYKKGTLSKEELLLHTSQVKKGTPATPFWGRVDKRTEDECWNWTGARNNSGYGTYCYKGTTCVAHRIAYLLTYGGITELAPTDFTSNQFVLHSCDNRACCNPKHLHLGTYSDNQKEAYDRLRRAQPKGSEHANSKLTPENVAKIKELYLSPQYGQVKLAEMFGISQTAISLLLRGETYK